MRHVTQHKETQHKETQHTGLDSESAYESFGTWHNGMLSITLLGVDANALTINVVTQSVVVLKFEAPILFFN